MAAGDGGMLVADAPPDKMTGSTESSDMLPENPLKPYELDAAGFGGGENCF